jgi:hypothetical protein
MFLEFAQGGVARFAEDFSLPPRNFVLPTFESRQAHYGHLVRIQRLAVLLGKFRPLGTHL